MSQHEIERTAGAGRDLGAVNDPRAIRTAGRYRDEQPLPDSPPAGIFAHYRNRLQVLQEQVRQNNDRIMNVGIRLSDTADRVLGVRPPTPATTDKIARGRGEPARVDPSAAVDMVEMELGLLLNLMEQMDDRLLELSTEAERLIRPL